MKKKGFSLLEMIVVIGVLSIALPTLYAIFFIILQQQVRSVKLLEVKKQGTYVSDIMTTLIRTNTKNIYKSDKVTKICAIGTTDSQSLSSMYFNDFSGNWFWFDEPSNNIASESAIGASPTVVTSLTSPNVMFPATSPIAFKCSSNGYGTPIITVNYTLCYKDFQTGDCGTGDNLISLPFEITVSLLPQ